MKKIYCIIINLIILMIPTIVQAFEVDATPAEVKSGETFNFVITMNEDIYLANGHLKYDPELFTYIKVVTEGISIEKIEDGELAWVYADFSESPVGVQTIEFEFTASSVIFNTEANFDITDAIYINTDETVYENIDFSKTVKILGKELIE